MRWLAQAGAVQLACTMANPRPSPRWRSRSPAMTTRCVQCDRRARAWACTTAGRSGRTSPHARELLAVRRRASPAPGSARSRAAARRHRSTTSACDWRRAGEPGMRADPRTAPSPPGRMSTLRVGPRATTAWPRPAVPCGGITQPEVLAGAAHQRLLFLPRDQAQFGARADARAHRLRIRPRAEPDAFSNG